MRNEKFSERLQMEANTNQEQQRDKYGMLNGGLWTILLTLFMSCIMSSCNPMDKVNELKEQLFGNDTEQVDDEEEESEAGESEVFVGKATTTDIEEDENEPEDDAVLMESLSIDAKDFSLPLGQTKQLKAKAEPLGHDETIFWKSSDERILTVDEETGVVKGVKEGSANVIAQGDLSGKTASVTVTITPAPAKSNPNYGTVNLGYGTYTGDLKGGKPHGHGTIVYSTSHKIVNSADYYASRGDKFEGDFRDGRISGGMGYWYHDGDITAINP